MPTIQGIIPGGGNRTPHMDGKAQAFITLPNNHSYIHQGQHYVAGYSAQLTTGQVLTLGVVTPIITRGTSHEYHLVYDFNAGDEASIEILEDVTSFSGGASNTPMNNNRNSNNTTELVITHGHTGSNLITPTGGSLLYPIMYLGEAGGKFAGSVGSNMRDDDEILLKSNSKYLFRLTDLSASTNNAMIMVKWYEYADKEYA